MSSFYYMIILIISLYFSLEVRYRIFIQIVFGLTLIEGITKTITQIKHFLIFLLYSLLGYFLILDNNPLIYYISLFFPLKKLFRCLIFYSILSYIISSEKQKNNHTFKKIILFYYNRPYSLFVSILFSLFLKTLIFYYETFLFIKIIPKENMINLKDKYFICSILPYYGQNSFFKFIWELRFLILYLGPEKVYVSLFDNNSTVGESARNQYSRDLEEFFIIYNVSYKFDKNKLYDFKNYDSYISYYIDWYNHALEYLYEIKDLDYENTKIIFTEEIDFYYQDIIRLLSTNKGNFDIVCPLSLDRGLRQRNSWIGIDGTIMNKVFPYGINKYRMDYFINEENIRMFSCGKGLVITKALPFKDKKVKFRVSKIKNKFSSEYTMISKDFYELGFQKVILNSKVHVYKFSSFRNLYFYYFYPMELEPLFYLGQYFWYFNKRDFNPLNEELNNDSYVLNDELKKLYKLF